MSILNEFPADARLWMYQSDRPFTATEKQWLEESLVTFVGQWAAHGTKLQANAGVIGNYHVFLVVDEQFALASGCSIDSSVRFIKKIGEELNINFFNRMNMLIEKDGTQQLVHFSDLKNHLDWTLHNPLIQTVGEFHQKWKIPVSERGF